MRVLAACEESQAVTIAFRSFGHEAFSCDLRDCSGNHPEWHFKCDVRDVLFDSWDLIIGFPPCTYLTKAGATSLFPNGVLDSSRFSLGQSAADFFHFLFSAPCPKICLENPTPLSIFNLPKPSQIIQPYYFGSCYSKRTCLWLKGLPKLVPTNFVLPSYNFMDYVSSFCHSDRQVFRSKTPSGLAIAMAEQWGNPGYYNYLGDCL